MEFKNKLVVVALSAALLSASTTFAAEQRAIINVAQPQPAGPTMMQKAKAKVSAAWAAMPTVTERTVRRTGAVALTAGALVHAIASTIPGKDANALQAIAATEFAVAAGLAHEDTTAALGWVKTALLKLKARIMNYPLLDNTAAAGGQPVGQVPVDQASIDREVATRVARNADIPAMLDRDEADRAVRVEAPAVIVLPAAPLVIHREVIADSDSEALVAKWERTTGAKRGRKPADSKTPARRNPSRAAKK